MIRKELKFKVGDRVRVLPVNGVCRLAENPCCWIFKTTGTCVGEVGVIKTTDTDSYDDVSGVSYEVRLERIGELLPDDPNLTCVFIEDSLEFVRNKELL